MSTFLLNRTSIHFLVRKEKNTFYLTLLFLPFDSSLSLSLLNFLPLSLFFHGETFYSMDLLFFYRFFLFHHKIPCLSEESKWEKMRDFLLSQISFSSFSLSLSLFFYCWISGWEKNEEPENRGKNGRRINTYSNFVFNVEERTREGRRMPPEWRGRKGGGRK